MNDSRIVIDEPGIRSVASNDMSSDLNVVFSKIIELSKECKYTTCTHENIKVCRILQAIENAKSKGAVLGRRATTADDITPLFYKYYPKYKNNEINKAEFSRLCNISYPSIFKYINIVENKI